MTEFSESANLVVIGTFQSEEASEAKEFLKTADASEDAVFGVSYDKEVWHSNVNI